MPQPRVSSAAGLCLLRGVAIGFSSGVGDQRRVSSAAADAAALAGDAKRGENIFWNHPIAACKNCHVLKNQGSAVGPPLDGIATRKDEAYILESLMNPNAKLAEGFEKLGISPMPPMNLILKPQEFADVKAFILSLK